jgi:hypothetical protein
MSVKIQIRRDLAANWGSTTVLASGEFGYETDTGNLKIGDGATQWQNLAYYQFPNVSVNPAVDLDLNSTRYRVMGRYRLNSITPGGSTFTNVPTDFGSTVDADSVSTLIVTTHAYPSLTTHVQQLLTQYSSSGSDLRQWVRLWNGTAWTNWSSTAHISDGEITTVKIADDAVTAAKLADDASTDVNRAVTTNHIRDVAVTTAKIADDAVTFAKIQNSAAAGLSVIGRSANSAGDFAEINAANDAEVLRRSGTAVGFGTIATNGIANDAVTYAKIQNVTATDRVLGRSTAGAGDIEEITCTPAGRALLDDADAAAQRTTLGVPSLASMQTYAGVGSFVLSGVYQNQGSVAVGGTSVTQPSGVTTAGPKLVSINNQIFYTNQAVNAVAVLIGGAGAVWRSLGYCQSTNPDSPSAAVALWTRIS